MRTGTCRCGNRIFFNNHVCLSCHARLGRCTVCGSLASLTTDEADVKCDACHSVVHACVNQSHGVCHSFNQSPKKLCHWCEFTNVIPPLDRPDHVVRWGAMESAKRRLLLQLEQLGFPPYIGDTKQSHPLRFEFLEDSVDAEGKPMKVTTGHKNGLITINLAEADSVHRERLRVQLGERQRTLIGHMRHEAGHYIDWAWARRVAAKEYHSLFGNPGEVDYSAAKKRHYKKGPPADWHENHVSAYSTMHPWEDFAETVNVYLDIMAIATTANDIGGQNLDLSPDTDAAKLVESVLDIVIRVSEYNLDLGLLPLLPERLSPTVVQKLSYVHSLRSPSVAAQISTQ